MIVDANDVKPHWSVDRDILRVEAITLTTREHFVAVILCQDVIHTSGALTLIVVDDQIAINADVAAEFLVLHDRSATENRPPRKCVVFCETLVTHDS